uniref:(northern house mosquito) hypothetical protein n=1 Tax=Culex pipiens TaxID=7175 RepID=A0A8D8F320_CULPI
MPLLITLDRHIKVSLLRRLHQLVQIIPRPPRRPRLTPKVTLQPLARLVLPRLIFPVKIERSLRQRIRPIDQRLRQSRDHPSDLLGRRVAPQPAGLAQPIRQRVPLGEQVLRTSGGVLFHLGVFRRVAHLVAHDLSGGVDQIHVLLIALLEVSRRGGLLIDDPLGAVHLIDAGAQPFVPGQVVVEQDLVLARLRLLRDERAVRFGRQLDVGVLAVDDLARLGAVADQLGTGRGQLQAGLLRQQQLADVVHATGDGTQVGIVGEVPKVFPLGHHGALLGFLPGHFDLLLGVSQQSIGPGHDGADRLWFSATFPNCSPTSSTTITD